MNMHPFEEYEFIIMSVFTTYGNEIYTKEKIANILLQNTSKLFRMKSAFLTVSQLYLQQYFSYIVFQIHINV